MRKILFSFYIIFVLIVFSGCSKKSNPIVDISIQENTIPEYVYDEFKIDNIKLIITYESGESEEVFLDKSMLSEDDLLKLTKVGTHEITIYYGDLQEKINVNIIGSNSNYKVNYFLEDLNGEYQLDSEEDFSGETFSKPQIEKTFEGYSLERFDNIEISPDNQTIINSYYRRNKYTLSIYYKDSIYKEYQYKYGEAIVIDDPYVEDMVFTGFDSELPSNMPSYNININASFKDIYYTCKFVNYDGTVLSEFLVKKGSLISYSLVPSKEKTQEFSYMFVGWKDYTEGMTADDNYVFVAEYKEMRNLYRIKFVNYDDSVIHEYLSHYGDMIEYNKENPSKPSDEMYSYNFVGWDKEFSETTDNTVYKAVYEPVRNYFFVTTKVGNITNQYKVMNGDKAIIPEPIKVGYTFVGWNKDISVVTDDITIEPIFEINKYKLTYTINGEFYKEIEYKYNEEIALIDEPQLEGKKFKEWQNLIAYMPAMDYTINARYYIISDILSVEDLSKEYDGIRIYDPEIEKTGDGRVAFEYYQNGVKLKNKPVDTGEYVLRVYLETTENYYGIFEDFNFVIYKRKAEIIVDNKKTIYGEEQAELTYKTSRFLYNPQIDLVKDNGTDVGIYNISASYVDDNYDITIINGTYEIMPAPVKVQIIDLESTYKEPILALDYKIIEGVIFDNDELNIVLTKEAGFNAGEYLITGSYNNNNYDVEFINGVYTINKAESIITASDYSSVYNGNNHLINPTLNHNETVLEISHNEIVDAGEYIVIITANETDNYLQAIMKVTYVIEKAETIITASDYNANYNGQKHTIVGTINHNESSIIYSENDFVNAGSYEIELRALESKNYKEAVKKVKVQIDKINSVITADNVEVTYDGNIHYVTGSLNHNEIDLQYVNNSKINAGNYDVIITAAESTNYLPAEITVKLIINKAQTFIDASDIEVTYDGNSHSIIGSINHDEVELLYENNTQITAGSYDVIITAAESTNYLPAEITVKLVINKAQTMINASDINTIYDAKEHYILATINHNQSEIVYTNNGQINSGKYDVTVEVKESANYFGKIEVYQINIEKAEAFITTGSHVYTYDGKAKEVVAILNHTETTLKYTNNVQTNAGEYDVVITAEETLNYTSASLIVELKINKAKSVVNILNDQYTYDGNEHSIVAELNHNEAKIEYSKINLIKAGSYEIVVNVAESLNYEGLNFVHTLIINKAKAVITSNNLTVQYDKLPHNVVGMLNHNETELEYSGKDFVNAGTYSIVISSKETDNYLSAEITVKLTIYSGDFDYAGITFSNANYVFDGKIKNIYIEGTLPTGMTVEYVGNGKVNAGSYEVQAIFTDTTGNYNDITPLIATLKIEKAESIITASNYSSVYNGNNHLINPILNHDETVLEINHNSIIDAGIYEVVITAKETDNYMQAIKKVTYVIEKAETIITASDYNANYNGQKHTISGSINHNESSISYSKNDFVNAGSYEVEIKVSESKNYKEAVKTVKVKINKINSVITADNVEVTYDGKIHSITGSLNHNEVNLQYVNNSKINAGNYDVKITAAESINYLPAEITVKLIINKAQTSITIDDKEVVYNGAIHSLTASASHNEAIITFTNNNKVNAGTYEVVAFMPETTNYKSASVIGKLIILKAESVITLNSKQDYIYNGMKQGIKCSLNHNEVSLNYTNNDNIKGGKYTVTVSAEESYNYKAVSEIYEYNIRYLVKFYNYDGSLLYQTKVLPNEKVEYLGTIPTRAETETYKYEFKTWDTDFTVVNNNLNIYPIFNEIAIKFNIVFKDSLENDYKVFTDVEKGTILIVDDYPTKSSLDKNNAYKFVKWGEIDYDNPVIVDSKLYIYVTPEYDLVPASCKIDSNYYATIEDAVNSSKASDVIEVINNDNACYDIYNDITIPAEVTLYIPYADGITVENASGTIVNGNQSDDNLYLTVNLYSTINVYGSLVIGGQTGNIDQAIQGAVNGKFSEIIMYNDSKINVGSFDGNNIGIINCFGYIVDNSEISSKAQLNVYTGSKVIAPFVLTDWLGGTFALNNYSKVSVFNRFQMPCINAESNYYNGSLLKGVGKIYAGGQMNVTDFRVFGCEEGNGIYYGLIYLTSDNPEDKIVMKYSSNSRFVSPTDYSDNCEIKVYGDCTDNYAQLKVSYQGATAIASTKGVHFPLHYGIDLTIMSGTFVCKYRYKVMPGAKVTITEGATIDLQKANICVFDSYEYPDSPCNYPIKEELEAVGKSSVGQLIINGKLICSISSKCYLGGNVTGTGTLELTRYVVLASTMMARIITDDTTTAYDRELLLSFNGNKITKYGTYQG